MPVSLEVFQLTATIVIGLAGLGPFLLLRRESAALDRKYGADPK